ncbi:hypothetical protein V1511DRAFT_536137, partial [Dipodascopsis uninucleata]
MDDFVLFDSSSIRRPSTSHYFHQPNSSILPNFGEPMVISPFNGNNSAANNQVPMFRRRESYSLPASLSSTPTQPSFLSTYYGNNKSDFDSMDFGDMNSETMFAATQPSPPGLTRSCSDELEDRSLSTGADVMGADRDLNSSENIGTMTPLRDPFVPKALVGGRNPEYTMNENDGKQYSFGHSSAEGSDNNISDLSNLSSFKNPKLERTISDVLEDELYSPNMSPVQSTTSDDFLLDFSDAVPPSWGIKSVPTTRTVSPVPFSRDQSPFRKSSPFYQPPSDISSGSLFPNRFIPTSQQSQEPESSSLEERRTKPRPLSQQEFGSTGQKSLHQQLQHLQMQKQQQQQQQQLQQLQLQHPGSNSSPVDQAEGQGNYQVSNVNNIR